jgi:hypothetical protein
MKLCVEVWGSKPPQPAWLLQNVSDGLTNLVGNAHGSLLQQSHVKGHGTQCMACSMLIQTLLCLM